MSIIKAIFFAAFIASVYAQANSPFESAVSALQAPLRGESQERPTQEEAQQAPCNQNSPVNGGSANEEGSRSPIDELRRRGR